MIQILYCSKNSSVACLFIYESELVHNIRDVFSTDPSVMKIVEAIPRTELSQQLRHPLDYRASHSQNTRG
jgi:hypothetical protein